MPYLKQERRKKLDDIITELGNVLKYDGDLNYVLFCLCRRYIEPSYNNYKNYCGELNECVTEIRRKILSELEDEKICQNGDII